jgi:heat shock protein HslJ
MNRLLLALLVASLAAGAAMAQGTAPTGAKPVASLENTSWKLVAVGNAPAIIMPPVREASFMLHPADHRLSGSGGCNRLGKV